jgi:hypothetical protein
MQFIGGFCWSLVLLKTSLIYCNLTFYQPFCQYYIQPLNRPFDAKTLTTPKIGLTNYSSMIHLIIDLVISSHESIKEVFPNVGRKLSFIQYF